MALFSYFGLDTFTENSQQKIAETLAIMALSFVKLLVNHFFRAVFSMSFN
jgi:hypothetical protein